MEPEFYGATREELQKDESLSERGGEIVIFPDKEKQLEETTGQL